MIEFDKCSIIEKTTKWRYFNTVFCHIKREEARTIAKEDLIPFNQRTVEEQKRIRTLGGIASGVARRNKKAVAEQLELLLEKEQVGRGEKKNGSELISIAQFRQAVKGDAKAFELIMKYTGQKPIDNTDSEEVVKWTIPITDITKDFVEPYREIHEAYDTGKWRCVVLKGGRGGAKSNFIHEVAYETIRQDPQAHIVFTRRYKSDLRATVYTQFVKTVERFGDTDNWEFLVSPLKAIYKPTGQEVAFVGCDKPIGNKSSTMPFGYVKMLINEEADEMAGLEQMDSIEDTFLRDDVNALNVKVFNPQPSQLNFMNKFCKEPPDKTIVFNSNYLNVPTKWLGQRFKDKAEWFRRNKEEYYRNYYLGEVVGTGTEIFTNIEVRHIDEQAERLFGLDFGYEHPMVLSEVGYDKETKTVYIYKSTQARKCSHTDFARQMKMQELDEVICDSANPDKIKDLQEMGVNAVGAVKRWEKKGKAYTYEWLQTRNKIVIEESEKECATQFLEAERERLKDGTISSALPNLNDDHIDAVRYALNRIMRDEEYDW